MIKNPNNLYSIQSTSPPGQYIKLNFLLNKFLEKDWAYPNFELLVTADNPMLYIDRQLIERHGKIENIKLYLDPERNNLQKQYKKNNKRLKYQFNTVVGSLFKSKGGNTPEQAQIINVFYDFDNGMKCPLQLA